MARKAGIGALLPFALDGDGASPMFQQLYRQLRQPPLEHRLPELAIELLEHG